MHEQTRFRSDIIRYVTGQFNEPSQQPHNVPQFPPQYGGNFSDLNADRHQHPGASDALRTTDYVKARKAPPSSGWRKAVLTATFGTVNLGRSGAEKHMDELIRHIKRTIKDRYVIGFLGNSGKTTVAAALGQTFNMSRNEPVIAVDADPGFGLLANRIFEEPPGDIGTLLSDGNVQGYKHVKVHLGVDEESGLEVLAGHRYSQPPRPLTPQMFAGVMGLLARSGHEVVLVDCGKDLEHPVMQAVLRSIDQLVLVSGVTVDQAKVVERTIQWLKAAQYHDLVARAMIILNDNRGGVTSSDLSKLRDKFSAGNNKVVHMPFDAHLSRGGIIDVRNQVARGKKDSTFVRLHEIAATLADFYIPDTRPRMGE